MQHFFSVMNGQLKTKDLKMPKGDLKNNQLIQDVTSLSSAYFKKHKKIKFKSKRYWKSATTSDTILQCLIFSLNAIDDFERQVRRLEDKIHSIETEKDASENAKKYLEDEIKRLNQ